MAALLETLSADESGSMPDRCHARGRTDAASLQGAACKLSTRRPST